MHPSRQTHRTKIPRVLSHLFVPRRPLPGPRRNPPWHRISPPARNTAGMPETDPHRMRELLRLPVMLGILLRKQRELSLCFATNSLLPSPDCLAMTSVGSSLEVSHFFRTSLALHLFFVFFELGEEDQVIHRPNSFSESPFFTPSRTDVGCRRNSVSQ